MYGACAVRVGIVGGLLSCIDCALVGAALPSMRTDLGLSDGRLSLFVSLSVAGMMLASLGGRRILQGMGRRGALRLAAVCVIAGVGLIAAFGGRFPLLAAGRVLQGAGLGLVFLTVPVVLAESVPAGFRGRAVCLYQLMMPVGMVVGALLGGLFSNVLRRVRPGGWHAWHRRYRPCRCWRLSVRCRIRPT